MAHLKDIAPDCLVFIVNHVFLPPKLPQKAEEDTGENNSVLLKLVHNITESYSERRGFDMDDHWRPAVRMLTTLCELEDNSSLSARAFERIVTHMETGDVLVLHIGAQNAGLIMRQSETEMVFESFEASPGAEAVISTTGKLLCSYPGPAIAVDLHKVKNPTFLVELASFLGKMKRDVLEQATRKGYKAGSEVSEERENPHPKFITGMLTGILRAIGSPACVERIQKRIADDVLWENARIPWRRSPLWLVIRVALQTTLRLPDGAHTEYKAFMAFFMAKVLELAIWQEFPSDTLFIMNAKLSRRLYKMHDVVPGFVLVEARRVGERANDVLSKRWSQVQNYMHHSKQLNWNPQVLSSECQLSMTNSREYLLGASNLEPTTEQKPFVPREVERFDTSSNDMPELSMLSTPEIEEDIDLADFECWVNKELDSWVTANIDRENACSELGERIEDYISAAKPLYASNPERTSILILTTMELWVALDRIVVKHCHLLSEYYPEFADDFLAPLLLPQLQQRIRLHRIEEYLKGRRAGATTFNVSVFSNTVTDKTFAVRYFENSQLHKDLERHIKAQADLERDKRKSELPERNEQYEKFHETAHLMTCQYFTIKSDGSRRHDRKCERCKLVAAAEKMRMPVHEWPLPEDELQRKTVVFELHCPLGFSVWRDMTYKVLVEICTPLQPPPKDPKESYENLSTFSGLREHFQGSARPRGQRLQWSSFTKSFLKSHYRQVRLPTTVKAICVNHGLRYGLFDTNEKQWTEERISESNIRKACTFRLPDGPYKKLQYTVKSTFHTPNQVISRQSECPTDIQLHEYVAFGLVRAGHRVQWLNILRELRSRTFTFSNEAVKMLFVQCAWQVGPPGPSKAFRVSHEDLKESDFGRNLLFELNNMLKSIEANWQEVVTAQTLIILASQLLSFSKDKSIIKQAVEFLRKARRVCLVWTRDLSPKLPDSKPGTMRESQFRVLQMAVTCRETYNVEPSHLQDVLHSGEDVAILVECAAIIHHNAPAMVDKLVRSTRALLDRDRRLSHAIENHVRSLILNSEIGLDLTSVWDAYKPGSPWECLPGSNRRWIVTSTAADPINRSQKVHYNLLNGQLLVEGLPLGRMPSDYVSHPTYLELFRDKVLNVFPSRMGGMVFECTVENHQVGFAMQKGELVIRTRRVTDSVVHQLIPRARLKGDFPTHIVEKHLHWLEISSGKIELRDQEAPWRAKTPHPWYISGISNLNSNVLCFGQDEQLLDVRSQSASMITSILRPLENAQFIDIRYSRAGGVTAHLPRLKLDFFVNRKEKLECRQFPDMVVDSDRNIGTLIGLENRLVVRQNSVRSVIIPYGKVHFEQYQSHVRVEIDTKGEDRVKYHIYTIDPTLGRLVGNGSLASHLYKIYLHAVTASCLPDALTSRTGTEEALSLLRAAATWSFQTVEIGGEEAELFGLIASLTPTRGYYPPHLKYMQRIKWNCLSPVSQHDEFGSIVQDVSTHASRFNMFQEADAGSDSNTSTFYRTSSDSHLLIRAAIRNASFRTEEFGGSFAINSKDATYSARDAGQKSKSEARVWHISGMVERWSSRMNVCSRLMEVFVEWGELRVLDGMLELGELGYDQKWLDQDLADVWCELYNTLTTCCRLRHTYKLIFLLSTLAYSKKADLDMIETLLAFATVPAFRDLPLPPYPSFHFTQGFKPDIESLYNAVTGCAIDFGDSDEADLLAVDDEGELENFEQLYQAYSDNLANQSLSVVYEFMSQWPCEAPSHPGQSYRLLNVSTAVARVTPLFNNWYRNMQFQEHVEDVQDELDRIQSEESRTIQTYSFSACKNINSSVRSAVRLEDLLARDPPELPVPPTIIGRNPAGKECEPIPHHIEGDLEYLLQDIKSKSLKGFWKKYAEGLRESFQVYQSQSVSTADTRAPAPTNNLESFRSQCMEYSHRVFRTIRESLVPRQEEPGWIPYKAGLWPRISPMLLLQQLATNGSINLSVKWKNVIVTYGKSIAMLQRSQRLLQHACRSPTSRIEATSDFIKELENTGHQQWDPMQQPDWLLMEIENNLLVRPVQADIASKMISPPSNKNAIMQLCMGEGKTSVIVPIAAAALADGKKLVRVVVLKPLSGQMFQTLVKKLGGLVNRRIFFMPFSRGVKMGIEEVNLVRDLFQECMQKGGILLVQPEHMLSFKLLGLEKLYNTKHKVDTISKIDNNGNEVSEILLETQRWLEENSRDILDESDEILNIRHELIYTIGEPKPIQNHPDRWVVVQEIFELIRQHFRKTEFNREDFEVESSGHPGGFDSIRILSDKAGREFLKDLVSKVIADQLLTISFRHFPPDKRRLAQRFITDPGLHEEESMALLRYYGNNDISTGTLFLLRGLIVHNILLFSLKDKRWKVDYGLDLKRSMLAVPYRAKDSPAGKAEFSHPDVTITLTCLSYYYGGLTESQLEICFRNVYKSDNPAMEYERWLKGVSMPNSALRQLNAINLEDKKQWKDEIFPTFRYNKAVIDFYLSGVVFPKEAKEFSHKLSTSGWDIAGEKVHPTTGFSGTNDNQYLLPLSITQIDREELDTNARVISYLLQGDNKYKRTAGPNGERPNAEQLLKTLTDDAGVRRIRVLLDVGAQVLELRNEQVAEKWLDMVPEISAKAAVYFNDSDELTVRTRDGTTEPLMISAYAEQLDACLVYLDEAHTRGTDLKLPMRSRAAVTLGPGLTKDRLVQACMRMRKLGQGHSVLFCGPPEIDRKLHELSKKNNTDQIEVRDVLYWCMKETCFNTRKLLPVWAKQGVGYQKRLMAYNDIGKSKQFPRSLLEQEAKTLQECYGLQRSQNDCLPVPHRTKDLRNSQLSAIKEKCLELGVQSFRGAQMLEEQERELSHEVECERENQRPPRANAFKHYLFPEVKRFIKTGTLPPLHDRRRSFIPAFEVLNQTSASEHWEQGPWSQSILATTDFAKVIERKQVDKTDDYLRPVNWIVSSNVNRSILVIMSPYEVDQLLPKIRQSRSVVLHLYSPRVTKASPSFEGLEFCPIPRLPMPLSPDPSLVDQLNLFAGQLYFRDYEAYERVCGFLGLYLKELPPGKIGVIRSDGFADQADRQSLGMKDSRFSQSPVAFLRTLVGFRRKGQSYIATHIGHILHGRLLSVEDFEHEQTATN